MSCAVVPLEKILRNPQMELKMKLAVLHAKQVEDTPVRSRKHHKVKSVLHTAQLLWAGNAVLLWSRMFTRR